MKESILQDKRILVIIENLDVFKGIEKEIVKTCPTCDLDWALNYKRALDMMVSWSYDLILLDIMGDRVGALLEMAALRHSPVAVVTSLPLSWRTVRRFKEMGSRGFLPKEKLGEIAPFLEAVLGYKSLPGWKRCFEKLPFFFNPMSEGKGIFKL